MALWIFGSSGNNSKEGNGNSSKGEQAKKSSSHYFSKGEYIEIEGEGGRVCECINNYIIKRVNQFVYSHKLIIVIIWQT